MVAFSTSTKANKIALAVDTAAGARARAFAHSYAAYRIPAVFACKAHVSPAVVTCHS